MTSTQPAGGVPAHRLDAGTLVTRIGYGAMQLAGPGVWGPPDDPGNAVAVLREAVALGVNFLDTANAYGPRTVNRLIAEALHPYPDGLIVGNKVGADRGPDRSWLTDNRPETLRRQVHEALTDLRVEASERTYLRLGGDSQAALSDVSLEESLGALVDLRDQGLIRRIGLSGADASQLRRARAMTPIAPVENRSGVKVLADWEVHGTAFVPYWPLAFRQLAEHNELEAPARRLGASYAQVALAWLLRRSPVVVAIPDTTSVEHLRSNVAAGTLAQRLTDDEVTALTALTDESAAVFDQPAQSTLDAINALAVRTASARADHAEPASESAKIDVRALGRARDRRPRPGPSCRPSTTNPTALQTN
jgi:pyridoxine 4-dehydrogenase